jgi:hypothetical protein
MAHRARQPDFLAVGRRDAGAFLAAILERAQPQGREVRRQRVTVVAVDAALVIEFIEHRAG